MKILISTGGSGGHIFPALYAADELRKDKHEVLLAGALGIAEGLIKKRGFNFVPLEAKGLTFSSPGAFFAAASCMARSIKRSSSLLKEFVPDVVAGFGGYGAFPVVFAAMFSGYPTIIHEQNVVPGKANRVLAKRVTKVAVSFSESRKYFDPARTVVTGCPCRINARTRTKQECRVKFGLDADSFTILVLGGSQGSHRINEEFAAAVPILKSRQRLQVVHLAGKKDSAGLREKYAGLGIKFCVFDFLEDMEAAYTAADLVISRAGAVTVWEIAMFGVPAVLIPYPFAGGHQKANAEVLCRAGGAVMIEEKDLSAVRLAEVVAGTGRGENLPARSRDTAFVTDAAKRLAAEITLLGK